VRHACSGPVGPAHGSDQWSIGFLQCYSRYPLVNIGRGVSVRSPSPCLGPIGTPVDRQDSSSLAHIPFAVDPSLIHRVCATLRRGKGVAGWGLSMGMDGAFYFHGNAGAREVDRRVSQ
jgi:hypothetical protein